MINRQTKVNKNAGFSMIELIVVIAIMAVMVGIAFIGFGMLNGGNAKKAEKNILSQLADVRTSTLAKAGLWTAEIYSDGSQYKIDIKNKTDVISSTKIGSRISIAYQDSVAASEAAVDKDYKLVVSFSQGTGAVTKVEQIPTAGGAGVQLYNSATTSAKGDIVIKVNASPRSTLTLWYATGKVTTDY